MKLLFKNMVFNEGVNVTFRRGVKWDLETEAFIDGYGTVPIKTRVIQFDAVTPNMIKNEHDPSCRTWGGLFDEMLRIYPGFYYKEIVTMVEFDLS